MSYHCRDCSYRGTRSGPSGECAACGSFNIVRAGQQQPDEKFRSRAKFQRAALIISWTVLLVMILRKILQ